MKLRPIIVCITLFALAFYLGIRFYAQHRPIHIYVSGAALMPVELADGLHMREHKIDPKVEIETSYEDAKEKILSMDEIGRIRSRVAWSKRISPFIDSLTIQSATRVLARRTTSRVLHEYQLVKNNDRWIVESAKQREILYLPGRN